MTDPLSLADQGDRLERALSHAVTRNRHIEYEQDHPQHTGPDDTELAADERYSDPLQGSGNRPTTLSPYGADQELFAALCNGVGANPYQRW